MAWLVLTSFFSHRAFADEVEMYQVEILLFKHNRVDAQPERSHNALKDSIVDAIQLHNFGARNPPSPFTLLPRKDLKLKREDYVLRKRKDYRVLLHIAWYQQFNRPRHAQNIHIYAQSKHSLSGTLSHN